jgi:hypothetical protein
MRTVFEQGSFSTFSSVRLDEARSTIPESYQFAQAKTTVFISHKHDELEDVKGVLGFLEKNYGVKVYIDSRDTSLPKVTSAETATQIKQRIERCNKFIFLATNGAIESKWCNWELGYGDAKKYKKNIALFPMKPAGTYDYAYLGTEYMSIYPYISYYDGTEKYTDGSQIKQGYYVRTIEKDSNYITPLADWFRN